MIHLKVSISFVNNGNNLLPSNEVTHDDNSISCFDNIVNLIVNNNGCILDKDNIYKCYK